MGTAEWDFYLKLGKQVVAGVKGMGRAFPDSTYVEFGHAAWGAVTKEVLTEHPWALVAEAEGDRVIVIRPSSLGENPDAVRDVLLAMEKRRKEKA